MRHHPDQGRLGIALAFILLAAAILADGLVGVPWPLAMTGPITALLLGVRAALVGSEDMNRARRREEA